MEISLVRGFGWSLKDIDETDIETLFPFVIRFAESSEPPSHPKKRKVFVDQVSWL